MSLEIKIEQLKSRTVLEINTETSMLKIPKALGENFAKINAHIKATGEQAEGAPYARYLGIDWAAMRNRGVFAQIWMLITYKQKMRVGMPTTASAGDGEIKANQIDAGSYITAIHRGPYHKVDQTYKKIVQWAEEQNVNMADFTIENYMNDPTEVASEDIETLIMIPVQR